MFRLEEYTGLLKNKVINGFIVLTKKSKKKKKKGKGVIDIGLKSNRLDVKSTLIIY